MTEYDQYITHFSDSDGPGTDHLVAEELGDREVRTACGLEMVVTGSRISGRQTFISELTEETQIGNNRCGNCPWDDTDY